MPRIFKDDYGTYSYELKQSKEIVLNGNGYKSPGEIEAFFSRLAFLSSEVFKTGNLVIEE